MKVGLQINRFDWGGAEKIGPTLRGIAAKADEVGFDSEWVMDHFFQIEHLGPPTDPMLEAYTALGHLAAVTKKVTLGTMVTGVIYREPALLVKAVTTLDVLSGGRAVLGIGAGWNEAEAVALGLPRPLSGGRFEKLEETLEIAKQMWAGDEKPIHGKQFQLERPINSPQALTKPHPPILIGGSGEQKTLRLVAKYADACNLFARDDVKHKLDVLRQHCEEVGRNYDEIEKTAMLGVEIVAAAKEPDAIRRKAEELAGLGIQHVIFANGPDPDLSAYDKLAKELLPALRKL
ncbi:MAG TPA: LLM class F420-dependent oxidoreductase [Candidatus Saccharimonadia bacterium]|jgi:F420-dependent oxidoreductase-like protein